MTARGKGWIFALATALILQSTALLAQPASGGAAALTGTVGETQTGLAAVYNRKLSGRRTASGERLNLHALTTAHATLPFGTKVRITKVKTGKNVVLRVNDRGPRQPNRIVDVTHAGAKALGIRPSGMGEVNLEVVEAAKPLAKKKN